MTWYKTANWLLDVKNPKDWLEGMKKFVDWPHAIGKKSVFLEFMTAAEYIKQDEDCREFARDCLVDFVLSNYKPVEKVAFPTILNAKVMKMLREFSDDFIVSSLLEDIREGVAAKELDVGDFKIGDRVRVSVQCEPVANPAFDPKAWEGRKGIVLGFKLIDTDGEPNTMLEVHLDQTSIFVGVKVYLWPKQVVKINDNKNFKPGDRVMADGGVWSYQKGTVVDKQVPSKGEVAVQLDNGKLVILFKNYVKHIWPH